TNATGCDSIVALTLTVNHSNFGTKNEVICIGTSYNFNGTLLTLAGTYHDTVLNVSGCDSVITLTLSVDSFALSSFSQSICSGDSFNFNGTILTQSGTYHDTITIADGCDSIVTLSLTVNQSTSTTHDVTACDSLVFGGVTLTQNGIYHDTIINSAGCDSVITLNLTVNHSSSSSQTVSACDNFSFAGILLIQSGI